jgi:hypothetical protein
MKPGASGTLTTTYHHPFYDLTEAAFVDAQDLAAGDALQTPNGVARITSVRLYHATTVTYDLTIADQHTYYVETTAGTPLLRTGAPVIGAPVRSSIYVLSE